MSLACASNRLKTSTASRSDAAEPVAGLEVDEARRLRADRVVLDQRPRAEVAPAHAAEDVLHAVDGGAADTTVCDGAGDDVAGRVVVGEARLRERRVGVERQPRTRRVVVGELDAVAVARAAGFGRAGVADEDQLGVEAQRPQRQRSSAGAGCARCGRRPRRPWRAPAASRGRAGSPVAGSTVIVAPRASLLWKPRPPFT